MSSEANILHRIMLALGKRPDVRLFRNNVGVATFPDGSRVAYGLAPGSSDIIGWQRITITPDMVGQSVAVFIAIEAKGPKGRVSDKQVNFIETVNKFGGKAGVAHTPEEAEQIINKKPTH